MFFLVFPLELGVIRTDYSVFNVEQWFAIFYNNRLQSILILSGKAHKK